MIRLLLESLMTLRALWYCGRMLGLPNAYSISRVCKYHNKIKNYCLNSGVKLQHSIPQIFKQLEFVRHKM